MFETFGFQYSGPIDGHALPVLMTEFERLKDAKGPQLLHVVTTKGKGFGPAEADPIKYHGILQFDHATGAFTGQKAGGELSYSQILGDWLCRAASQDPLIVGITAAMSGGSGLGGKGVEGGKGG